MSITQMLKESVTVSKKNLLVFVPMLAASVFSALLSLALVGSTIPMVNRFSQQPEAIDPNQALAAAGAAVGAAFLVMILSAIVGLLAHGMTVAMADLALKGEQPSLGAGWKRLMARLVPMIIASVVMGLIIGVGTMLLVLPGLIAAFLLMFTLVSVMVDDAGAFEALGRSFRTVTQNFKATFVFFLVAIALGLIAGILSVIVGLVPLLGAVLTMIVSAIYTGFISIYIVRAYRELGVEPGASPEAEV